jgi:hypothetical protein
MSNMSGPAWIISFPKSGRTWLRVLLGKALCEELHLDETVMLDIDAMIRTISDRAVTFFHDRTDIKRALRFDEIDTSKVDYADSTVVLLVRDPRDVIVSCYFQASKRRRVFDGPLEAFIRDERYGIRKCAAFHRIWSENQHVPQRFHLVRYEEMQRDPGAVLRSVLSVLGIPNISSASVQRAVSFGEFDNMHRLESTGYFDDKVLRPGDAADPDSFKVRRGQIGGYTDYASASDISYMNAIMAEEGGSFYAPYLRSAPATGG